MESQDHQNYLYSLPKVQSQPQEFNALYFGIPVSDSSATATEEALYFRTPISDSSATATEQAELHSYGGDQNLDYFDCFPPGYRFCPSDEELIIHYLRKKVRNEPLPPNQMVEVDIYQHNPEKLSKMYRSSGDKEWYFLTPRERKYPNGSRPKRSAEDGYWKATGADRSIKYNETVIGFRKALVFHEGKPPKGKKTDWIMHEFRVNEPFRKRKHGEDMKLDECVLCRIYKKFPRKPNKTSHQKNQEDQRRVQYDEEVDDEYEQNGSLQYYEEDVDEEYEQNGVEYSEMPQPDSTIDRSGEYFDTFVNQSFAEVTELQYNNVAAPSFNDHIVMAPFNGPTAMASIDAPFKFNAYTVMDSAAAPFNGGHSTTMASESMFESIHLGLPSLGFTYPHDQHSTQESINWSSSSNSLEKHELQPRVDPIYYSNFSEQLMSRDNTFPSNPLAFPSTLSNNPPNPVNVPIYDGQLMPWDSTFPCNYPPNTPNTPIYYYNAAGKFVSLDNVFPSDAPQL